MFWLKDDAVANLPFPAYFDLLVDYDASIDFFAEIFEEELAFLLEFGDVDSFVGLFFDLSDVFDEVFEVEEGREVRILSGHGQELLGLDDHEFVFGDDRKEESCLTGVGGLYSGDSFLGSEHEVVDLLPFYL